MFDVGFSELLVIGVVALLVIGPEKLPSVARTVGALLGRMQRYVNDVKADISREIELDELKKMQTTVQDAAKSIETSVNEAVSGFQAQADEMNKIATGEPAADPFGLTAPAAPEAAAAPALAESHNAASNPSAASAEAATVETSAGVATANPVAATSASGPSPGSDSPHSGSHQGLQASLPLGDVPVAPSSVTAVPAAQMAAPSGPVPPVKPTV